LTDLLDRIAAELVGRYEIERELGSGGMATVYLARDVRYSRQVAVKVLKPDIAAALGAERFLREIRITAQLNHPHILPLLDSGEAGGFLFYVMPYAAGESLRRKLNPRDPLSLDVTISIARPVAAALDHAHRHGVIHRDVKPENILFSEGLPVVSDFGIAKAVSAAGGEAITRSGFPMGTPGYMSPEQASGHTELNAQTDVCGLACVVYEMLVGETPGVWSTPDEVRVGRFTELTAGHRERLERFPGRVEQVLVKALAIRCAQRFATPLEFVDALVAASERSSKVPDGKVREILGRAGELQEELPTEDPALSIGGVEQVAAQVGIAPQRVREALAEAEPSRAEMAKTHRVSVPTRYAKDTLLIDRTVSGEVAASEHPALVDEIQSMLGVVGHVSVVGKSLTWSPAAPGAESRKLVITVTSQSGRTRIHVEERFELAGWRLFAPGWGAGIGALLGAGFGALIGLQDSAIAIPAIVTAFGGAYSMANAFIRIPANRRKPQLEQLADRLALLCESGSSTH
jgi:serine/threonine protein kinase